MSNCTSVATGLSSCCKLLLQASVDSQSSVGPVPQSGVRDLEKSGHSLHGEKAARRQARPTALLWRCARVLPLHLRYLADVSVLGPQG